ncbi:YchJ family protein [Streptomyces sp. ST2-7A]|uniref:YchJ family protein n=1 Tax=Streptomyces sp. ST2-7A TaxID=2907214 RepID=UPI001F2BB4F9|nr:YchJ family metal-binding protein [Streptomyces sp. ST2-7A]MCE7083422.1 hypothetical protein [Streptomyces sp. ST2-7A]
MSPAAFRPSGTTRRPRPCPCGAIGEREAVTYDACCGPAHRAESIPANPERLMRSRYSAFALGDAPYLTRTWHPTTRPDRVDPDPALRWERLEVLGTDGGGPFHPGDEATVEFRAHWRHGSETGMLHEVSRFRRTGGRWYYLDGDIRE